MKDKASCSCQDFERNHYRILA
ncbi:SWIM zinc finger family protein [Lysinibacillus sp. NPDC097231]